MPKRLPPGTPYANRRSDAVQFQANDEPEAYTLLQQYAGSHWRTGRFISRLIYEHHARVTERMRMQAEHPGLAGAVAAGEEVP